MDTVGTHLVKRNSLDWQKAAAFYPTPLQKWSELSRKIREPVI